MPNRVVCSVIEEMRKCHETRNYSYLLGLIEEVQSMVNRMEAALYDQKDAKRMEQRAKELKAEIVTLKAEKAALSPPSKNPHTGSDFDDF